MSYTIEDRTFTMRPVTLALEDKFREMAFDAEEKFSVKGFSVLYKDGESLNAFMRLLLKGDHTGIDWFTDIDSQEVGAIIGDFFTMYADKMQTLVDSLTKQSEAAE